VTAGVGFGGGRTETLDGLRGIAVLAVVIEHAWPNILPGGFAGVDVFFVLSGYLITGLLVRELRDRDSIDLVGFYARRVRRIVPAALLCVLGTWLLFTFLLGPAARDSLRVQATAATLSFSNILFARDATDYFAADPAASPYLHFWSLAVEEQFYLVWPTMLLLLAALARRVARRQVDDRGALASTAVRRWLPVAAIALLGLASLALALAGDPTEAFFLLPHRGWELIAGGLLAFVHGLGLVRLPDRLYPYRVVAVAAGAVALAAVFVLAPSLGGWPGPATVLAVAATSVLVAGGDSMPGAEALRIPPLRFFGRISYSLYLWHWPLLAAAGLLALPATHVPLHLTLAAVIGAISLATVSTRFIEEPIRTSRAPALSRRRGIATALAALGVVAVSITALTGPVSHAVAATTAAVAGQPDLTSALELVRNDRERLIDDNCYTKARGPAKPLACVYGSGSKADGSPTRSTPKAGDVAVLFGDSHAMHWFALVDDWARARGIQLVPLARSGCPPVDGEPDSAADIRALCRRWLDASLKRIADLHPVITFVSTSTGVPILVDGQYVAPRKNTEEYVAPLAGMLEQVGARSQSVLLLGDVPRANFSVPDCLGIHRLDPSACARPLDLATPPALVTAESQAAKLAKVDFIEPGPVLCPNDLCTWLIGDRIGWVDEHHISVSAALSLRPEFEPIFDRVAGLPSAVTGG
jgi:peptidoglycan/LPS O-acetylase OafA/YrhL